MEIKVKAKYLRISPRKLRTVLDLARGKNAEIAASNLRFQPGSGAKMVASLINNALAVAKNSEINQEKFIISAIACSDGPRLKRGTPTSKGRMAPIVKRQSHLTLTISDNNTEEKGNLRDKAEKGATRGSKS